MTPEGLARLVTVALVSLPVLAGCGYERIDPPAPPADPVTSAPAPPSPPAAETAATGAFPAELLGTWQSTGAGDALLVYRFDGDGTYAHAGVLSQQRPSGVFSYEVGASGSVDVDGERLVLRPESGTTTLTDPDSPGSSYQDRPMTDLSAEEYTWALSADGDLALTEAASGRTITYRKQS
ncbi:hypothetical protein FDA94_26735 [Herbidospora galbida]|uniref:Uncharacterized protein n=1 Tax=Herbidospora galbida TaxID=2575442 RepID=A0A4U3M8G5_9ACTN|nr:hypothetical protein [Herbidospora galbida]TKK85265.1 hypothetical protein FDA94_26735 [Herbidospora galbida]